MKKTIILFLSFILSFSINAQNPKREMRAVWIATVANIDWPSKPSLSTEQQKTELTKLLDYVKVYNLNTIVFQIRPAADAFYASNLEPWSKWLTGKQGQAPDPYYDPLEFAIKECRKRGLDIHVWLNPYRAEADTTNNVTAPNHITKTHPEWFLVYGNVRYFNPGLPETRNFVSRVVSDIVRRYDIDAVHMDDYFYPYRIYKKEFPDSLSFAKYPNGFAKNQKEDWRRNNVDLIIKQLHDSIRAIKPWVEFGISPFGVWRNYDKDTLGSKTKAGQTNYDDLYADILKWQKLGWIDYLTPQIYWEIGKKVADYAIIAEWWSRNAYGCPIYIGHGPYRIDKKAKEKAWHSSKQIINQIKINRTYPNISGSMYFSAKYLEKNPLRMKQKMLRSLYEYPSLPPVNNRIVQIASESPKNAKMIVKQNVIQLIWEKGKNTKSFVIYKFRKNKPATIESAEKIFQVTSETSISFPVDSKTNPEKYFYVVTSLSPTNLESMPAYFDVIMK